MVVTSALRLRVSEAGRLKQLETISDLAEVLGEYHDTREVCTRTGR